MSVSKILVGAVVVTMSLSNLAMARNRAPTLREQQEAACSNDAMTLCSDAVPDEARTEACLRAKSAQLSPSCAEMFQGQAPARKKHRR